MIIPSDEFTRVCVALKLLSDESLDAAQALLQSETIEDAVCDRMINALAGIVRHTNTIEAVLRAVVDETPRAPGSAVQ